MRCLHKSHLLLVVIALLSVHDVSTTSNENNDGTITWAPLPTGKSYNDIDFDPKFPLTTTWNSIDGFLKFISPGDPPYDIISEAIGGEFETEDYKPVDYYNKFKDNILGFIVCFAVGIIFIIVFPIIALCFCCCRCCCNNCGGRMEQKSPSTCKCYVFGFILLICCAFILGGVGTAYTLNGYTADAVKTFADDINSNIDNIVTFVKNTNDELGFIVGDQLNYTLEQIKIDLNDIGDLVGVPVRDRLRADVGPAITAVKELATSIDDTYNQLALVNSTQNELAVLYVAFKTAIDQVRANFSTDCTSCTCCGSAGFPDYNTYFVSNVDYQDLGVDSGVFPQVAVDKSLSEMKNLVDEDLASTAAKGEQTFEDIPETLTNTTQSDIDSISDNIDGFQDDISSAVDELTSELDKLTDYAEDWSKDVDDIGETANDYDKYRVYAMAGLFGIILLVPVIWLVGIVLGFMCGSKDALPTERGCLSNCGGCLLMTGAAIVFIFGTFFMLLTSFPFIIGGPIDRLFCDPFQSGEAFKQTVDKKGAIPGVAGYYLADQLLNNSSIALTVTGLLESCEKNVAVYTAFDFEYLVNISEYLDYKKYIPDIDSEFENITGDFSNIDILPASGKKTLEDFANSSVISINFTLFSNELDKDITNDSNNANDLSVSAGAITTYISTHSFTGSNAAALNTMATYLTDLQTNYIDPMIAKKNELKTALSGLEGKTSQIESKVNDTLKKSEEAQKNIDDNINSYVTNQVTSFSDRILRYVEQYVNYVNKQVQNEIGRCLPVYNFWNNSLDLICVSLLQSWNSLWFCIGWCLFFMIFGLIFSVKLAKYFRKMKYCDDTYPGMEMTQNKVHPQRNGYAPSQDPVHPTADVEAWDRQQQYVALHRSYSDATVTMYETVDTDDRGTKESLPISIPVTYNETQQLLQPPT
ncbi:prominin-1-A-like isoform X2 [Anneissia japonica]|uniref:prominin-1-A-like isoform X2 n=2 Tax=Anneissia japonica TaxID=1529436 RepID=UPI0014255412|nr:prominin-1-A-like isoform X2 [Anneissia japonica]